MADRYWVGGAGNWSDTARWSTTSGGAGGSSVPGSADNAIFTASSDAGSAFTATVDTTITVVNLTFTSVDQVITLGTAGNLTVTAATTVSASSGTNGVVVSGNASLGAVTLTSGTINIDGSNVTMVSFTSTNTNTRTFNFGTNGIITLTGNGQTIWNFANLTGFSYSGTPAIQCNYSGATGTRTIAHGNSANGSESTAMSFSITAGSDIISFSSTCYIKDLTFSNFTGSMANTTKNIYGNLTLASNMTVTVGSLVTTFAATSGIQDITSNGKTMDIPIEMLGDGTRRLQDALTLGANRTLTLTSGTFNANNFNVTTGYVASNNSNTRTITMGSGTWSLIGGGTVWNLTTTTGLTFNKDTANITIIENTYAAYVFNGGGLTYNNLTVSGNAGAPSLTINGNNTFGELNINKTSSYALYFPGGSTNQFANWNVNGRSNAILKVGTVASWSSQTTNFTLPVTGIAYGNSLYLAVTGNGSSSEIRSSTDGVTWTSQTNPESSSSLEQVIYGGSQFVAVGGVLGSSAKILTSTDGASWTSRTPNVSTILYDVAYGNSLYVAVGASGVVTTSSDGVTWTAQTSGTNSLFYGVCFGNNLFVAVGVSGIVYTSSDGITWTSRTSGVNTELRSVAYGSGTFVLVGASGVIRSSTDGVTWVTRNTGATGTYYRVRFLNGRFVFVGLTGGLQRSVDGINWVNTQEGINNYRSIEFGNGLWLIGVGATTRVGTISTSTLDQHTLTKTGGSKINSNYLALYDSIVTPSSSWYATATSADGGGNSGWTFTPQPVTDGRFFSMFGF